jgi:Flp pilus assembly protein TadG
MMGRTTNRCSRRGHAVIEVSLMAPWIFFLFMGILDFGFYAYSAISVENAARAAVVETAIDATTAANTTTACNYALTELQGLSNARGVTTCVASASAITSTQPIAVTAAQVNGVDGTLASQVSVTYQTIPMFAIPGVMGQMTITRTAQMRLRDQ